MAKIATTTVIYDGVKYKPGDVIPDLGSWVAQPSTEGMRRDYDGLSADLAKLPHYVQTGSTAFCIDTSEVYEYEKSTDRWYKL